MLQIRKVVYGSRSSDPFSDFTDPGRILLYLSPVADKNILSIHNDTYESFQLVQSKSPGDHKGGKYVHIILSNINVIL